MSKVRSDCVFNVLTPEQAETLEGWLFEEGLAYKDVLAKVKAEFKLETSLSGVKRYYRRLAGERTQEDFGDLAEVYAGAMAIMKPGMIHAGLLALMGKCAMQALVKSPERVLEFTALFRAITSAQALEMKRVVFQREEEALVQAQIDAKIEQEAKERRCVESEREYEEYQEQMRLRREAKKKAKEEAARAAAGGKPDDGGTAGVVTVEEPKPAAGELPKTESFGPQALPYSVGGKVVRANFNGIVLESNSAG